MDLPQPPQDNDLRNIIDKLAQFVARNGPEFEAMTKAKQKGNPKFSFLFSGDYYHYYTYKVNTEQAILRQKAQQQQQMGYQQQPPPDWSQPPAALDGWSSGGPPRPHLSRLDQQYPVQGHLPAPGVVHPRQLGGGITVSATPLPDIPKLREQLEEHSAQIKTLQEQITQSESNLAAQKEVTETQVQSAVAEAIQNAKREHLELLAGDTGMDLDEMDTVMAPIIESCTKDSISLGKGWIFTKAVSHDSNKLIAHYLAFRVTDDSAPFTLKLHLIYLMNDVLHHCARKSNEELKLSFEAVSVEMFCSAWISSSHDTERAKLSKLIRLWEDKKIFGSSTLNKMRNAHSAWEAYKQQLKEDYSHPIQTRTQLYTDTYNSYEKQHDAFVNHALNTITNFKAQIKAAEEKIAAAEQQKQQEEQMGNLQRDGDEWEAARNSQVQSNDYENSPGQNRERPRSSRWDAGDTSMMPGGPMGGGGGPPTTWGNEGPMYPPPFQDEAPPGFLPHHALPDLSRPPPGFSGPPPMLMAPIVYDEKQLIPTLPYYDLPAGLMVPLIPLEEVGYKPIDQKKIRLPPPTPPTAALIAALEQFYAPPSHERPRDPDGWEMLGLYEWSKDKTAAVKAKADAIESGDRERSPTASPDPYFSSGSTPEPATRRRPSIEEQKPVEIKQRKRYTSRSRSRTRSRSRESTPEFSTSRKRRDSRSPPPAESLGRSGKHQRSDSRSPSPPGSYSIPSYLTKSRKSPPESLRRQESTPSPPPMGGGKSTPPRLARSPSPEHLSGLGSEYAGFGSMRKLDSSNKGHQMMQKMGWKGSGLGSGESGIVEPVEGGELREKADLYRGVGAPTPRSDPFEAFRKNKAGSFYTRMKDREKDRNSDRKSDSKK